MKFIADLHVHSKFSRATAKNLDLENLYIAAQLKGVTVVGTGDFTYPAWFDEIKEKLEPAESGLFKLKKELAESCDRQVPAACRNTVRFILSTEISNIYKKDNRTRKNHNLVLVPDLESAAKFNAKLETIGNIKSDGRPILGLDARSLLEILLETTDQGSLIPAHIWTPWFSLLGSKSGFDSIEECFEDLSKHIFAVETGLSSDPAMNWRVSGLDGVTLVSNSDAHSPMNVGREANIFNTGLSYGDIKSALMSKDSETFLGTFEFYPEEGKYHLDGHRNCKVRLQPRKTIEYDGKCPVCGKALTLGVLYRVEALADRNEDKKPENRPPYFSIVQLADILSELLTVGPNSKKVKKCYQTALSQLGSEFEILHRLAPEEIERAGIPLLGEAIRRMRSKEIEVLPGYDGEYGRVKLFKPGERERLIGQKSLFSMPAAGDFTDAAGEENPPLLKRPAPSKTAHPVPSPSWKAAAGNQKSAALLDQLNPEQRSAVEYPGGALLIAAGPGTGKTRTLTHRIAYLILHRGASPHQILAVTFTNKAAQEMRARLATLLGGLQPPLIATFHALCLKILNEQNEKPAGIIDDAHRQALISEALKYVKAAGHKIAIKSGEVLSRIIEAKQQVRDPSEFDQMAGRDSQSRILAKIYRVYQRLLAIQGFCDYEDLIFNVVRLLETDADQRRRYREKFQHIFVDEYQDLNQSQYRILRALAPDAQAVENLCVIGDPDQSIYGFRGSDAAFFNRFKIDYPNCGTIRLSRNYRSTQTILEASYQIIKDQRTHASDMRTYSQIHGATTISVLELPDERAEAEAIAGIIEQQVGGTGFHSIDTGLVKDANLAGSCSYADFAVLYRTHAQHRVIADTFEKRGIPCQVASRENVLNRKGLPEFVSYLKILEGQGGFFDCHKILQLALPGLGKKAMDRFMNWCFQNRFSLQDGFSKVGRFPIPGMAADKQQLIHQFSIQLTQIKNETENLSVADKLHYLCQNTPLSGLLDQDRSIQEAFDGLIDFAGRFEAHPGNFLAAVVLHTDTDAYMSHVEKVSLMTMHAAKGLEFPVVFIAGCEQDLMPYRKPDGEHGDLQEERRLFYVAMTRAMERLYLSRAAKRRIYGRTCDRRLSSFVADIETQLKLNESPRIKPKKAAKPHQVQLQLF